MNNHTHFDNAEHAVLNINDENELIRLNKILVGRIKAVRNRNAALKRHTLKTGQKVCWQGRLGEMKGTIVRVKRKKAICNVGGQTWDVPLSMLKVV